MGSSPGAIILGNEYQALGLLRLLHTTGVKCVLVDQDLWGAAQFSRFRCRFYHSPRYESERFWPWIVDLAVTQDYMGWVIIPTHDEQVRQLAEHFDEIAGRFRYAGPTWDVYRVLYNKRLTYEWASQLGVAIPKTFMPTDREDLPTEADLPFPLVIKPAVKRTYQHYSTKKAIRADSPAQLQRFLNNTLHPVPIQDLLYQELIPGDGKNQWSYAGFFVQGKPVAAFTACRLRQHPPDFGRASTYVTAVYDDEVEEQGQKVMSALNYTGLAEVEWKRDPRDGRLKFLEVNARCWGWHSLASRVVGNLPKMLYDFLAYGSVHPAKPQYGSRWVKWITDVPVSIHLWSQREMNWRSYVNSLRGDLVWCEWDQGDPLPFFFQFSLLWYLFIKRGY